ncbi:hypothetical protein IQ219_02745 [Synechocystis sp. LEGE 06083]|uniref:hypothetical protein n=1 Tax=Synechocystis sp. LEGE 06083 TaxID=915336 RepID=UPI00187E860F|nr:hypothetical protein [Synechocystis sp. LEGE 06083]MBE9194266.1 hypothetical protein [Synechocystis sp. LEGE 06083]
MTDKDSITALASNQTNNYEANILIWSCLDILSNLWSKRIGKSKCKLLGSRLIFAEFLCDYYGDIFQKVSLSDVWYRIDKGNFYLASKKPDYNCDYKLPDKVIELLQNLKRSSPPIDLELDSRKLRTISDDLNLKDILTKFDNYECKQMDVIREWLMLSSYGAIAYKEMRNAYVHEGRGGKGSHGFQLHEFKTRPTYLSYVHTTPPKMGFSVEFMLNVLSNCIDSFEKDSIKLQQDPVSNNVS